LAQHRVFVLLVIVFGIFSGWSAGGCVAARGPDLPLLCVVGGGTCS
jgi:hypothetical protein